MRPTGKLHLGNLFGALENWAKLQDEYHCFFCVVDWHALTTAYEETRNIRDNVKEMVIDWLSCGIDPEKSVIFKPPGRAGRRGRPWAGPGGAAASLLPLR